MKKTNLSLVSICIPNYNNARYLDTCIKSALNQKYADTEVIFVDDNSSDNSLNIAKKYRTKIKIFRNETNLGQPQNTNKCVTLSKGKYVVILHSDDMLLPDFAEKLVPLLEKYPKVGIVVGERILTDEKNNLKKIAPFYDGDYLIPGIKQAKVFMMASFLPCQVLLRRDIFFKIGGIDQRHIVNLDGLLWFKCALEGDVAYTRDEVSVYRIHPKQTTAQYNRTINHMMENYITLTEMFKLGKKHAYLRKFFGEAVQRAAVITLRYCMDVIREKNYDLAKKYLILATVFDSKISEHYDYRVIERCLRASGKKRDQMAKKLIGKNKLRDRGFSYGPPPGSVRLDSSTKHVILS